MNDLSLKSQLDARRNSFNSTAPEEVKTAYEAGVKMLAESGIISRAKKVGDLAIDFTLSNATGKTVSLSDYLKQGAVVLTWYRGGWCPYCNLTLQALQKELANINKIGASLLALTPELPDHSMSTVEKNSLKFEVLSDINNNIARKYGIVYKLNAAVAKIYAEKFGLTEYNGNSSNELPLATTYVIDQNGKIIYAFIDADYRNRAEPSEIIAVLKKHINRSKK
jgi:peroxiredoxin